MNESTPSNRSGKPLAILLYLTPAAVLLLAGMFLWNSHSDTKDQLEGLSVQNRQLQRELAVAKAKIDDFNSGDSSIETRDRLKANRSSSVPNPVIEEMETLLLQTPTVEQISEGLAVRFGFEPKPDTELPDSITLVVRVPRSSDSKIVAFKAVGASEKPNITTVLSPTKDLCLIEGSPAELGSLSFELIVTAPVKATIRGSKGISDFEFDISAEECTPRKL